MSERIKKLYPEKIKALNDRPYHFGTRENMPSFKAYNPVCGDRFELFVADNDAAITTIHFHGFGCAISKASTSILAKSLEGKSHKEALALCDNFLRFITNQLGVNERVLDDEFNCFSAIHEFPERIECAALAWTEMQKFLESKSKEKR